MIFKTKCKLGYPARPVGGGELPSSFMLSPGGTEVATPKLNGERVLMCSDGEFYNRNLLKYTKMDADDVRLIHQKLNEPNDASRCADHIMWWDMEYMSHGPNKGCAVIIDVVGIGNLDYLGRRKYIEHLPQVSHKWTENLCSEWRESFETTYCPSPQSPRKLFIFPLYRTTEQVKEAYAYMRKRYAQYFDEDRPNSYLWEGVVVVDTQVSYKLTKKQSMNMHSHTKYKFR